MSDYTHIERNIDTPHDGYDMSPEEIGMLMQDLLAGREIDVPDRYVCLRVNGTDKYADIGRYIERLRFEQFFKNDAAQMREEYGPYESNSVFFLSVDRDGQVPTGVLRVIKDSPVGLKTVNDVANEPLFFDSKDILKAHGMADFSDCWDVGTVAVMPGYAPKSASIQLYRGMYLSAQQENVDHLVSVVDPRALKGMRDYLGIPFEPLAGTKPFDYLGSLQSQAVYGYVPEFYEKMTRHKRSFRGLLAREALKRLVDGSEDQALILDDYK